MFLDRQLFLNLLWLCCVSYVYGNCVRLGVKHGCPTFLWQRVTPVVMVCFAAAHGKIAINGMPNPIFRVYT